MLPHLSQAGRTNRCRLACWRYNIPAKPLSHAGDRLRRNLCKPLLLLFCQGNRFSPHPQLQRICNHIIKAKNEVAFRAFREDRNLVLDNIFPPSIFQLFDVVGNLVCAYAHLVAVGIYEIHNTAQVMDIPPTPVSSTSSGNSPWSSRKSVLNCHSALGVAFFLSGILHQAHRARRMLLVRSYGSSALCVPSGL